MSFLNDHLLCPLHLHSSRPYNKYTFLNLSFLIFITIYVYLSITLVSISMTSIHTKILCFFTVGSSMPGKRLAVKMKVAQSCLTFCDPMDYTLYGILQARILEWVAVPFSRGSSQRRDQTQVSHIAGRFFTS